ncbi:MAG: WYL domain-containing protein [Deltaproteobacteria bacterium]|nr:WYL domain-containing protein [Deltaproteobacteria bacterium]MBW2447066.1 WYL domain-containing protein [Deltaproteobacteria bacterium]
MPRYHRVEDIIQLALALQVPGGGLCLEDIQQRFEVGRRTAERMREAVDRLYPGLTSSKGADGRKYWQLPSGQANGLVSWLPEELDALARAIHVAEGSGDAEDSRALSALHDKVEALTAQSSAISPSDTGTPAAKPSAEPMANLQRAIVLDREIVFRRRRPDGELVPARARPYGLLGGARLLLVAIYEGEVRPRLIPVADIDEVEPLETRFEREPNVDLRRYAANAFLPFEEGPLTHCWRFAAHDADEALEYEFHPEQRIDALADGSVEIHFHAESLVELAWHLFAWGDRVEGHDLPVLKHRFNAMMRRALEARPSHQGDSTRA